MSGNEHLIFKKESTWGTWVTPDTALAVRTANIGLTLPLMDADETGGGRGRRPSQPGEISVAGSIVTTLRPTVLPLLLRSLFATRAKTGPTGGTTKAVTSSSVANPTVITTGVSHGFTTGQPVTIAGHTGSTPAISGTYIATVLSANTFSIPVTVTVGGTGGTAYSGLPSYKNKLLINDDVSFDSFSIQKRYDTSISESARGVKINQVTIGARTREYATCSIDVVAKDVTTDGSTWSDATSAPTALSLGAITYEPYYVEPLKFYQGVLKIGGSSVVTSGEIVVTSGTSQNDFDNIELVINENISTDAYGVNLGDRTVQSLDEGRREITVRFDPNFAVHGNTFFQQWLAGTPAIVELYFKGGAINSASNFYEMKFTLPYVVYSGAPLPEINNAYGLKRFTVEGTAFVDPVTGYDLGLTVTSTEDLTA
jgi:hypothetical protein